LQTSTAIALDDTTYYTFSVNTTAGSYAENRFKIVFKPFSTLPVSITRFTATKLEKKVMVEWQVSNQVNIDVYHIEKSTDGINFSTVKIVKSTSSFNNAINYNWLDENPFISTNYYRLKSVDVNGNYKYSIVVLVSFQKNSPSISISPNPATGNTIALQLNNQPKGMYTLSLINNIGQTIYNIQYLHAGNTSNTNLNLPNNTKNGNYQLKIVGPNNHVQFQKIVILQP
jgi:hypothetical protein